MAPKGKAGAAFRDGEFKIGGRLPINTHGGLLSHGYPGRAAGIGNLIEAVVQLRGEAGDRQVANAKDDDDPRHGRAVRHPRCFATGADMKYSAPETAAKPRRTGRPRRKAACCCRSAPRTTISAGPRRAMSKMSQRHRVEAKRRPRRGRSIPFLAARRRRSGRARSPTSSPLSGSTTADASSAMSLAARQRTAPRRSRHMPVRRDHRSRTRAAGIRAGLIKGLSAVDWRSRMPAALCPRATV